MLGTGPVFFTKRRQRPLHTWAAGICACNHWPHVLRVDWWYRRHGCGSLGIVFIQPGQVTERCIPITLMNEAFQLFASCLRRKSTTSKKGCYSNTTLPVVVIATTQRPVISASARMR